MFFLAASVEAVAEEKIELEIHSAQGARHTFLVEVARTPQAWAQGLMGRLSLAPRGGMLFLYPEARQIQMWMANTPLPLDMLFIRTDHRIARVVSNTVPYSRKSISSREAVKAVLELKGGTADKLGIRRGDKVCYPCPDPAETGPPGE